MDVFVFFLKHQKQTKSLASPSIDDLQKWETLPFTEELHKKKPPPTYLTEEHRSKQTKTQNHPKRRISAKVALFFSPQNFQTRKTSHVLMAKRKHREKAKKMQATKTVAPWSPAKQQFCLEKHNKGKQNEGEILNLFYLSEVHLP